MKQYAPACERNRQPIISILRELLPKRGTVLEVGSGSGQHAVWFAEAFPNLVWQPSERAGALLSINAWRNDANLANLRAPIVLDLFDPVWPVDEISAIICINVVHIVAWRGVEQLFMRAGELLSGGGMLYLYGPFRYADRALEPSNQQFDGWLKQRGPDSGIRDFAAVDRLATAAGLALAGDRAMPANNRSLWWRNATVPRAATQFSQC
ncbi:MAG: class I SAM-dependent methyltransferase [Gammaproteobacteria bacterium]|nr:class I SAM-dependent methyltransferase [Gammaproteobacteria bacterium]MDH3466753.1 class I SAM-dependent methyltransferase [Gammaproteobacteria bacterium]